MQRTIVVSAVNLRKGGTLTILRQCLQYLSSRTDVHTIALVHDRSLCDYPGIEYMEIPWTTRSWAHRLWCEYVTMYGISKELASRRGGDPVDVWLSLHDTTPRVLAGKQEVYCHTSFPFLKLRLRDWVMDPKIPLFALFTRWAYRINIHRNSSIIVQQNWFADAMSQMLGVDHTLFRVIPPSTSPLQPESPQRALADSLELPGTVLMEETLQPKLSPEGGSDTCDLQPAVFFYASTPDCHKNFETLCEASRLLEEELGQGRFKTVLTISGHENRYSRWLYKRWGKVSSIDFHGFMSKNELMHTYKESHCFVFPSRVETWGLPISEYMSSNAGGKMLLADLPYAHETSCGSCNVKFFDADDPKALARMMKETIAL